MSCDTCDQLRMLVETQQLVISQLQEELKGAKSSGDPGAVSRVVSHGGCVCEDQDDWVRDT